MTAFAGSIEMRPGESKPLIFQFTGASAISGTPATYIYRNGQEVSAVATGTTPSTILSGSASASGVVVTGEVLTIPLTGYEGAILTYVFEATVDGQILKPWIEVHVAKYPRA